jgi:hypothetical protein
MSKRWILIIVLVIVLAALGLIASTSQPGKVVLKDGTEITGEIAEKNYGEYVVIKVDANNQQVVTWDHVKVINEYNWHWYTQLPSTLWNSPSQLGIMAALIAFFIGLHQYDEAQKWKRQEFLVKEIAAYEAEKNVIVARNILDLIGREIELYPDDEDETKRKVLVTNDVLKKALATTDAIALTDVELTIRMAFDILLSRLEQFNNFIEVKLVKKEELDMYLKYWLGIIGNPNNPKLEDATRKQLWKYILANDYPGVTRLLEKFGYKIA